MLSTPELYKLVVSESLASQQVVGPRGIKTREMLAHQITIDMEHPIVTNRSRKLNYRFMAAEAFWICSGNHLLAYLSPEYIKGYEKYSDDGVTLYGAYGPPFRQQLEYVVGKLMKDRDSRQAVISLWHRNPPESKDIPCTLSQQYLIRQGKLYCITSMRSQDVWLGLPYDLFSFSMMALYVLLHLRQVRIHLKLGSLTIFAGSRHIYEHDVPAAMKLLNDGDNLDICNYVNYTPDQFLNELCYARDVRSNTQYTSMDFPNLFQTLCQSQT